MNRPTPFVYLIGNPLSLVAISVFALYVAFVTYQHPSWSGLIVSFVMVRGAFYSFRARSYLASYKGWSREWKEMSGEGTRTQTRKWAWRNWALLLLGFIAWYGARDWLIQHAHDTGNPEYGYYAAIVIGLTVLGVGLLLWIIVRQALRIAKRIRMRAGRNAGPHVVSTCLPIPRTSPRPDEIVAALPEYCLPLLQHKLEKMS